MRSTCIQIQTLLVSLLLSACSEGGAEPAPHPGAQDPFTGCTRGTLEPDFTAMPLAGPAVRDGELASGSYFLSSTYLQVRPESRARFEALTGAVMADLSQRPGLLAFAVGSSQSCSTARTLTVWRDEAAMLEFVAGDAHLAAMSAISEISRGGSVATHWIDDEDGVAWSTVVAQIAADEGPEY